MEKESKKELISYQKKLQEYQKAKQELKNTYGEDQEKERKLDLLYYQFNEIQNAKLKVEEETELEERHKTMQNAEKLKVNLSQIDVELNENAISAISNAIRALEKIEDCGEKYSEKLTILKNSYYDIQELGRDISYLQEEIDFDEEERRKNRDKIRFYIFFKKKIWKYHRRNFRLWKKSRRRNS